jgi:hypothetical protein
VVKFRIGFLSPDNSTAPERSQPGRSLAP